MAFEDEARLVARILDGEAGALERFISDYRPFVYAILTRHLNLSPDDADEVFQQFLIHLWEDHFRRLRAWSGRAPLTSYLGKIARNLARDYRRKRRLELEVHWPARLTVEYQLGNAGSRDMLETALAALSSRDRELIYRRYDLGQTYREIADELGITINRVGVSLSRAHGRLKRILTRL